MKNSLRLTALGAMVSIVSLTSCERNAADLTNPSAANIPITESGNYSKKSSNPQACNPNAYTITLESHTQVGTAWEWVWSVQNPNPGNGNNGTVQDLSHWGMEFGACIDPANITEAAYSSNGTSWSSFTPSIHVDPSQGCMTTPVLKFDYGTSGSSKSYYKLTINADYAIGNASGYYKSGGNTGCCTFEFAGVGCDQGPPADLVGD